ncbi:MAG TPA: molecular chaperone DnaJ [Caulobacteraceae bacterium]|nr:molecular chaperone DnaJ [Caulobacteraceae bacterium]
MRDYYDLLGVSRECDAEALKSAFRKQAMEHHPDRNDGCPNATNRFKEINEAYSVLSDPNKRAAYDRFGHAGVNGVNGGGFHNVHDIFNDVFGDVFGDMFGRGQRSSGPSRGQDLRYDLEISLEQAYAGAEVELKIPAAMACETCEGSGAKPGTTASTCTSCNGAGRIRRSQGFFQVETTCPRCGGAGRTILSPCPTCAGHGQVRRERLLEVRVPAGVDDGSRIRLAGEGDAGARGGPRGDLYIFISVKPHDLFERDGLDLRCQIPLPMATAALGGEIEAPCLLGGDHCDGKCKIPIKIKPGVQTGETVAVRSKGMPSLRSRQRGDLVVELFVETPTNLSARQKELLKEFSGACGEGQSPRAAASRKQARSFWEKVTGAGV